MRIGEDGEKKVLLVGSSYSAVPLLYALKSYDCAVSVCGNLKNDPAIAHADRFYQIDYSKKEALFELVDQEKFDYIVPSCNDFSYLSCAWVANQLGYPGFDDYQTAMILHTKAAFRSFALKNGLPVPKTIFSPQVSGNKIVPLNFPLLVKPIDSFSGRGISKVVNDDQLIHAVDHAKKNSRTKQFLIETFLDGTLHSHSAFLQNGEISADFFVDEYCTVYPYEVNCSCLSVALSNKTKDKVRNVINKMCTLLQLKDGLLHTQFIVNEDKFWLIESMRRAPGDLYGKLIELSTEVNYQKLFVSPFIDIKLPQKIDVVETKFLSRHTVSADHQISFTSFTSRIPSINTSIIPLKESGAVLKPAPYDKIAILFSKFESREDLEKYTPNLEKYIDIQT